MLMSAMSTVSSFTKTLKSLKIGTREMSALLWWQFFAGLFSQIVTKLIAESADARSISRDTQMQLSDGDPIDSFY